MECVIQKKSDLIEEIKIKVDQKGWKQAIEKVYEKEKGKYSVQGWRKGKVPQKVIEQNYGDTIFWEDALYELANEGYIKAMAENKDFDPVGTPQMNVDKVDDNGVEITITCDVIPPVKLAKYTGLTVSAPLKEFSDEMVEHELLHAQIHKTTDKKVDRKSKMGDIVTIDFVGSVDGKEFEGGKAENHKLELGSKSFVDNFEEQLVGHKAGEKVEVNITFPKNYGAKALAGKKAKFDCEIKSVNEKVVPKIDDDFAKSMGDYKNLEEYKEDIKAQLLHEIEHQNKNAEEDAILKEIVTNSTVILPPVLIKENLDNIMHDLEYRLAYQGINLEDYAKYTGTTVEKLREERQKDAEDLTKTKLVLEALVKAENLSVSQEDAEEKLKEIAKIQEKSLEEVKKMFDKKSMDRIYSDILLDKLTSFLKANNKVEAKHVCDDNCCHDHKKPAKKTSTTKTKTAETKKADTKTTKSTKSKKE